VLHRYSWRLKSETRSNCWSRDPFMCDIVLVLWGFH
jgi:hypothetical protein